MRQSTPLTWAVPPGNAPYSVACLYGTDVSEIIRVLRCTDSFGVLNLGLDHSLSNADISAAGNETRRLLQSAHAQRGSDYKNSTKQKQR